MSDARPIGLFDSGVGGLTVLREVSGAAAPREHRSTSATTPARPTAPARDEEVHPVQRGVPRPPRRRRRQGDRGRLQHVLRGGARVAPAPVRGADPGCRAAGRARRGAWRPGPGAWASSRPRRRSDRVPTRRPSPTSAPTPWCASTRPRRSCRSSRRARSTDPLVDEVVRGVAGADAVDVAAAPAIDTLLLGCTHYPLLGRAIARGRRAGRRGHRLGLGHRLRRSPCLLEVARRVRATRPGAGAPIPDDRGRGGLPAHGTRPVRRAGPVRSNGCASTDAGSRRRRLPRHRWAAMTTRRRA